jgi:uncharacterized protein YkwD
MFAAQAPVQPVHAHAAASRVEIAIVRALNRTRAGYGLPALHRSRRLFQIAGAHSRDLAVHGIFSHSGSDGSSILDRMRGTGASLMGENLVELTGRITARRVVQAWMNSPPHRQEILTAAFRLVGVGTARGSAWTVVTADFTS